MGAVCTEWIAAGKTDAEIIDQLYLTALSRQPLAEEQQTAQAHVIRAKTAPKLWDIAWAVINSKEFLFSTDMD